MATTNTKLILETVVKWTATARKQLKGISSSLSSISDESKTALKQLWALWLVAWWLVIRQFAAFEKQMSKVKAITNATEDEFVQLNKLAKEMGATTAFTAKEAWDAFEFLWMAWLSVKESLDALPWTLQLAAAWNLALWEAADIATNIMAQFWIKAKDIWRVNDVLAKSATSANTSVWELAEAMKFLWPVANAMKVPLEETAAAIDVLANNGIKWGMAWQSFSASLLRITKLTPKMAASVEALNLSLFDQKWEFVWLIDTVKQLEAGTKSMTDEEKAKHISTLFGIQSTKQWLTLLKEGSWTIQEYTTSLENAWWAAEKMAEIQLDNLAGSFTLLKSAVSWAMIDIGWSMNNELRPQVDLLTESLSKNSKQIQENWEAFAKVISWMIFAIKFLVQSWFNLWKVIWFIAADIVISINSLWESLKSIFTDIKNLLVEFATAMKDVVVETFTSIVNTITSKINAVVKFFKDKIRAIKKLWWSVSAFFSWWDSWSIDWARAKWWPVSWGKSYLVWEQWPEIFSPQQNGQIIPNNKIGSSNRWAQYNITISWIFWTDAVDEIWDQLVDRLTKAVFV